MKHASIAQNSSGERVIKIKFTYDADDIHKIRSIPGRKYHPEEKCWSAPIHFESVKTLMSWGFVIDENLQNFINKIKKREEEIMQIKTIPGLNGELMDFQKTGVSFIEQKNGNCLIADDMGLGKTIQALAWLVLHNELRPVIIVCPASLKLNWKRELEKWMVSPKVEILSGKKLHKIHGKIIIINYDILFAWADTLKKLKPQVLITDEAHFYKNTSAKRTKAVKKIGKEIPHKIALTGTPIENRPIELYNAISFIDPTIFTNRWYYMEHFCNLKNNGFGWDASGASNLPELHQILISTIMIRRKKQDVLKELPDKIYSYVPMFLDNKTEYKQAEDNFIKWVRSTKGKDAAIKASSAETLTKIEGLKQLAAKGKLKQCITWIEEFLETENKLVVFATHKFTIDTLMTQFPKIAVKIDGSVSEIERQKSVDSFQNDPNIKLFVGNIQAAGIGITLTAASKVAFIEFPWSPSALDQAADRCILKGELVLTKDGYIPIEDIKIGDLVYTHKGNWKRVTHTKTKLERKKRFYDIKYKGFFKPLRCTEDHLIYVFDYIDKTYNWVCAANININKHAMVFPGINIKNYKKDFIVKKYKSNNTQKIDINTHPNLTENLLYAFGNYVGNGWVNNHQVNICDEIKDYKNILRCINAIKKEFGIKNHGEYKRDHVITLTISSIELRDNFKKWFGDGAHNKIVPDFIFHLSKQQIKFFLNGYYSADGYKRKNTQQASTVSKYLSYQIIMLEGIVGNAISLRYNDAATAWSLEYSILDKTKRNLLINMDGENSIYPISEIRNYKPKRNDEKVYDLTVEDDESFVVGLSSVHNCHRIGQKDNVIIYYLMAENTIDEKIAILIDAKRKVVSAVMDGETVETTTLLSELMNSYY